jgi:ribonuclease P protein component
MNKQHHTRRFGFSRQQRVRHQTDFDRVRQRNVYAAGEVLVIQGCCNGRACSRLGLSVSRRVGNAVLRNRWKRVIREAFRLSCRDLPPGMDMVIRPRRGAEPDFAAVARDLRRLTRRLEGLLRRGPT